MLKRDFTWPAKPLVVGRYLNYSLQPTMYLKLVFILNKYQSKRSYCLCINWKVLCVFQLETKFKDPTNKTMTEREEPLRCLVRFTSTNLLESFRQCASSGKTWFFSSLNMKIMFSEGNLVNFYESKFCSKIVYSSIF